MLSRRRKQEKGSYLYQSLSRRAKSTSQLFFISHAALEFVVDIYAHQFYLAYKVNLT